MMDLTTVPFQHLSRTGLCSALRVPGPLIFTIYLSFLTPLYIKKVSLKSAIRARSLLNIIYQSTARMPRQIHITGFCGNSDLNYYISQRTADNVSGYFTKYKIEKKVARDEHREITRYWYQDNYQSFSLSKIERKFSRIKIKYCP